MGAERVGLEHSGGQTSRATHLQGKAPSAGLCREPENFCMAELIEKIEQGLFGHPQRSMEGVLRGSL